jgi:hypothetical protein
MAWEPDANVVDEGWLASFVDWWNGPGAWVYWADEDLAVGVARGVRWR